ncbi:hypothetical protein PCANC_00797 [Puccinia coronata f. sp. avenae]|uniref:Uncharacterized protein n=1 Tax=Puccinia coronata f. sp. avenae TaxID=200324 RepID=A0A2N5STY5_9BASI|nr:hypothetical protein PCANC_13355 [Puccinia coronata f. sp. avenae]PLW58204.1 hypothetical protein PCANC_00797 [Puccinia coronata f. sp. avenae]
MSLYLLSHNPPQLLVSQTSGSLAPLAFALKYSSLFPPKTFPQGTSESLHSTNYPSIIFITLHQHLPPDHLSLAFSQEDNLHQ